MSNKHIELQGHVFTQGGWTFEIKTMVARKVESYGEEFTGVASINITDGEPHIEALHCDDFTMTDYKDIRKFISNGLSFPTFQYSRYSSDLQRKKVNK